MAENQGQGQPQGSQPKGEEKEMKIKVSVDDEQYKRLADERTKLESDLKKAQEDLERAKADKTKTEEEKKAAEDAKKLIEEKAEDLEEKLKLIAAKEFEKKRAVVLDRAKKLFPEEGRFKEIETKTTSPEDLKATEYLLDVVEQNIKEGEERYKKIIDDEKKKIEEEAKKKAGAPAGSAPLNDAQLGKGAGEKKGYDSVEAMVHDLRVREHSSDPSVAAEATQIINELFAKWANAVKKGYGGRLPEGVSYEPKEQPSIKEMTRPKRAIQAEEKTK